jgi:hypothetical protein
MAHLIRNEINKLDLYLSYPEHPEAKKYLREFYNELCELIGVESEIAQRFRVYVLTEARFEKLHQEKRASREEHYAHKLAMMRQAEQQVSGTPQLNYRDQSIQELTQRQSSLIQSVAELEKEVNVIDNRWQERQALQQGNLLSTMQKQDVHYVGLDGKAMSHEKFAERLKNAPPQPSLKEKISQPDLRLVMNKLVGNTLKTDKEYEPEAIEKAKPVLEQIAWKGNVFDELHLHRGGCECFDEKGEKREPTASEILASIRNNKKIGAIVQKECEKTVSDKANDIGSMLCACNRLDQNKKELGQINLELKRREQSAELENTPPKQSK